MAIPKQFQFIVVNLKQNATYPCSYCTLGMLTSYTRDLSTGLTYHSHYCLSAHVHMSQKVIEYAKTSQLPAKEFYR
jgi:hypothetical protein